MDYEILKTDSSLKDLVYKGSGHSSTPKSLYSIRTIYNVSSVG